MHRPAYFNSHMWEFPPAAVPLLEWEMKKKLNAFDDWDISEILYLKSIYYPNEISANLQKLGLSKLKVFLASTSHDSE